MGRAPCCDKAKVKTGPWSPTEDLRLTNFIQNHGHTNWRALPKQAGLLRCGKSCRLRWINYLRPDLKRGNFTPQEEQTIIQLHTSFGNKWSKIASCLPGRTDNEIKNVWNTHLKKRLLPNSASSSCSTTISKNAKKIVGDDDDDKARLGEKSDFMKENVLLDSPLSSSSSSSRVTKSHEATFQQMGEMDFSWEFNDVDFWEIWESINPNLLDSNNNNNNNNIVEEEKIDDEVDQLDEWLRCIENELGITNDNDDGHNT